VEAPLFPVIGKVIEIDMKPKEPDLIDKLFKGLRILKTMQVHDFDGRVIEFEVESV
jgi:hypothetical protein